MEKKILLTDPPITTYPAIANILSILWSRKDRIMPWLSDHFIQIVVRPNHQDTFGDFYDHADLDNFFRIVFGLPGLEWMRVNEQSADYTIFTDYVEHLIDKGYCLEACLDRFYLSNTRQYQKKHFVHSTLIYGYDKEEQKIFLADFFEKGRYLRKESNYVEVNQAANKWAIINIYRAQDDYYDFNPELMKMYIQDYTLARDSFHKFDFSNKEYNKGVIYGIGYYDYLLEKLELEDFADYRMYHLLLDHKSLMDYRIEYLASINKYNNSVLKELKKDNLELIEKTKSLRNSILKYSVKGNQSSKEKLINYIINLKNDDYEFMNKLLSCIE